MTKRYDREPEDQVELLRELHGDHEFIAVTVWRVVKAVSGKDADRLDIKMTWADLEMDSLELVETAIELELEFDIEIRESDMENAKTVGDLIRLVEQKAGKKS